jgi:hypothetical protein
MSRAQGDEIYSLLEKVEQQTREEIRREPSARATTARSRREPVRSPAITMSGVMGRSFGY